MSAIAIIALSLVVGLIRLLIPGHDLSLAGTYEALAHILVGALIVLSLQRIRPAFWSLIAITAIEVVMFLIRRLHCLGCFAVGGTRAISRHANRLSRRSA